MESQGVRVVKVSKGIVGGPVRRGELTAQCGIHGGETPPSLLPHIYSALIFLVNNENAGNHFCELPAHD